MVKRVVVSCCVVFLACAGSLSLPAEEDTTANSEVLRIKAAYEAGMQRINDEDLAVIVSEQEKILGAMKAVQKQLQAEGNLDQLLIIGSEIERFTARKKIETANISRYFPDIVALHNSYMKIMDRLPVDRARKITVLVQGYEKALTVLQESYTRKNDIKNALAVKTEREVLANNGDIISAKAILAELDAKAAQNKLAEKPAEKSNVVAKPGVESKDAVKKKKYTGSPEKRVRQRFDELCKNLFKLDMSRASDLVDPEFVDRAGNETVRRCFNVVFPFLQSPNDPRRRLSLDSVKLEEDGQTAILVPKMWSHNQWVELPANKWVEIDDDWYIDISAAEEVVKQQYVEKHGESARPWRPPLKEKRIIRK